MNSVNIDNVMKDRTKFQSYVKIINKRSLYKQIPTSVLPSTSTLLYNRGCLEDLSQERYINEVSIMVSNQNVLQQQQEIMRWVVY